jgi:DNA-binding transcriptional regulator YiaG
VIPHLIQFVRRKILKMNLRTFAKEMNVSYQTIWHWENAMHAPPLEAIDFCMTLLQNHEVYGGLKFWTDKGKEEVSRMLSEK